MQVTMEAPALIHKTRAEARRGAVSRVINVMRSQLCDPLTLHDMADIACLSPYHFNRVFKVQTGLPPNQFLYSLRLQRAKELLVESDLSVTEVCLEVGYNSIGSFTNRFTSLVGVSPMIFREFSHFLESQSLSMIKPMVEAQPELGGGANGPKGELRVSRYFDGLIFMGVFKRAIPEGMPITCLLKTAGGEFEFPRVKEGKYYVFSIAVPWSASMNELLTLSNAHRGRSDRVVVDTKGSESDITLNLMPSDPLHPPILAAIPLMIVVRLSGMDLNSTNCAKLLNRENRMRMH